MNKVTVNDHFQFDMDFVQEVLQVNNQPIDFDLLKTGPQSSHIIHDNKSYTVEVVDFDKAEKLAHIKVNGNVYQVQVTTQLDLLLKQLGMDNLSSNKILQIKAPMPGLVLNVLVSEGTEVKKGDNLLVLEAMKMENMIKSPTDGVIKKIEVKQGDKVEKNELLVVFS